MPLSSRSGTMKCVLLRTMSGTDNPVDRYLPVSSATCNSLVVIIGPPKKWNLCSILSLEGRIFYMELPLCWFSKEVDFFFIRDCFQKKSTFFIWDFLPAGFQKKSTFFYTRLFSKEVDFFFHETVFKRSRLFTRRFRYLRPHPAHKRGVVL